MAMVLRLLLKEGTSLVLPHEAVVALGSPQELYLYIDAERQLAVLSVKDPDVLHNESILDQLAQLNEGISLEEYGAPVPEDFLNRRHEGEKESDE